MEHAGVRVLLFTDIEGSTALLQRLGPRYVELLTADDQVIRSVTARYQGEVVDTEGDGYFVLFDTANSGLGAALDMQLGLARQSWPENEEYGCGWACTSATCWRRASASSGSRSTTRPGSRPRHTAVRCSSPTRPRHSSNGFPTASHCDRSACTSSAMWARPTCSSSSIRRCPTSSRRRASSDDRVTTCPHHIPR